jgi:rare lipoprotein A
VNSYIIVLLFFRPADKIGMKQINRIFVVFFILAAFGTLYAQNSADLIADPFYGANAYAGSPTGAGDFEITNFGSPSREFYPFRQEGIASWYGTEFEGHPTASGEVFNPNQLTAAHPTLPFGTILRITNTQNNRQVSVRVNDRGPFVNTRIIDVSRAAAEVLDMLITGTAPVVVETISAPATAGNSSASAITEPWIAPIPAVPALPPAPAPAAPIPAAAPETATPQIAPVDPNAAVVKPGIPAFGTDKRYRVQVGAYKVTKNAVDTFDRVKGIGLEPSYERYEDYYRVVIGDVRAEDIQTLAGKLGSLGFREVLIRE